MAGKYAFCYFYVKGTKPIFKGQIAQNSDFTQERNGHEI